MMTSDDGMVMNKLQLTLSQNFGRVHKLKAFLLTLYTMVFVSMSTQLMAAALESVGYSSLPGEKAQIVLTFSETIKEPSSFSVFHQLK